MKEHFVNSFGELHDVKGRYRKGNRWLFRGHSDLTWILKPKAGRDEFIGCDDKRLFRAWKRRAAEFKKYESFEEVPHSQAQLTAG